MAHTNTTQQAINGNDKVILVLDQSDYSALTSLLFELRENENGIREIARDHNMGLGANHIESLAALWGRLNLS